MVVVAACIIVYLLVSVLAAYVMYRFFDPNNWDEAPPPFILIAFWPLSLTILGILTAGRAIFTPVIDFAAEQKNKADELRKEQERRAELELELLKEQELELLEEQWRQEGLSKTKTSYR